MFKKSSFCGDSACVEVDEDGSVILMRQTEDPENVLEFDPEAWKEFLGKVHEHEFDV